MGKDNDYRVGYGKPPSEHQFKKGKSGNRRGRPSKRPRYAPDEPLDFKRSLVAALQSKLTIVENGKKKQVTMMDAINKVLVTLAAQGDKTAIREVLSAVRPLREELFADRTNENYEYWIKRMQHEARKEAAEWFEMMGIQCPESLVSALNRTKQHKYPGAGNGRSNSDHRKR
jgi:hypothetical protein